MFDNLLSNPSRFVEGEGNEGSSSIQGKKPGPPMIKTKTITKNYGTRLGKPTVRAIFQIEKAERKKTPAEPLVAISVQQLRLNKDIDKQLDHAAQVMVESGEGKKASGIFQIRKT